MPAEPPPRGFYPPDPYSGVWLGVGLGLLLVVVLWYLWVWWSTRARPVRAAAPATGDRLQRLREDYTRQIDLVVARAGAGQVSPRQAAQQLSALVRHFVQDASGIAAPTMTLSDLVGSGPHLAPVTSVVGRLYPGEFAPRAKDTVAESAEWARQVVAGWS